jgi:hypothetical protein
VVWRVAAQHCEREPKQTTTHVELLEEGLWTRVQFPPAPPNASLKAANNIPLAAFFFYKSRVLTILMTSGNY